MQFKGLSGEEEGVGFDRLSKRDEQLNTGVVGQTTLLGSSVEGGGDELMTYQRRSGVNGKQLTVVRCSGDAPQTEQSKFGVSFCSKH